MKRKEMPDSQKVDLITEYRKLSDVIRIYDELTEWRSDINDKLIRHGLLHTAECFAEVIEYISSYNNWTSPDDVRATLTQLQEPE